MPERATLWKPAEREVSRGRSTGENREGSNGREGQSTINLGSGIASEVPCGAAVEEPGEVVAGRRSEETRPASEGDAEPGT